MSDPETVFDFGEWCAEHQRWSEKTFGPIDQRGPKGPADHLIKEVRELNENPTDLEEVADIVHLAWDSAWRAGHTFRDFVEMLIFKQKKNQARDWPDWKTAPKGKAIEHVRSGDEGEKSPYPEHEKLKAVVDKSQAIGEFLEWLSDEKGVRLCCLNSETGQWRVVPDSRQSLLAEAFDIDLNVLEDEKRAILYEQREANKR